MHKSNNGKEFQFFGKRKKRTITNKQTLTFVYLPEPTPTYLIMNASYNIPLTNSP